jgi:probable deoxyuridine 5'-triphosphate nucleotidohydrolase yncF
MQHECQCKQNKTNIIKVKYRDKTLPKLQNIEGIKSDWIDLYASQDYELKQGEFKLIDLNVVVEIPKGYEGHIAPRSSTFKNFGIIQTNSVGVVDNSYCGDEDYLKMPVLAMRDTIINKGDRICQFRIFKKMEETIFEEVEVMDNENRGGIGSTGTN